MKTEEKQKYKNLGYVNSWEYGYSKKSEEYIKCQEIEKHETTYKRISNCNHSYTCDICKIVFMVDSSD